MRRKDREVQSREEIFDILRRCECVKLGMHGAEYPYVVPVSFGLEVTDGKAVIYFHGAREGAKPAALQADNRVCVEAERLLRTERTEGGITARYESVIGFGRCEFVTDPEELLRGIRLINEHYGFGDYPVERCGALEHMLLGRIVLEEISGKRNLPTE